MVDRLRESTDADHSPHDECLDGEIRDLDYEERRGDGVDPDGCGEPQGRNRHANLDCGHHGQEAARPSALNAVDAKPVIAENDVHTANERKRHYRRLPVMSIERQERAAGRGRPSRTRAETPRAPRCAAPRHMRRAGARRLRHLSRCGESSSVRSTGTGFPEGSTKISRIAISGMPERERVVAQFLRAQSRADDDVVDVVTRLSRDPDHADGEAEGGERAHVRPAYDRLAAASSVANQSVTDQTNVPASCPITMLQTPAPLSASTTLRPPFVSWLTNSASNKLAELERVHREIAVDAAEAPQQEVEAQGHEDPLDAPAGPTRPRNGAAAQTNAIATIDPPIPTQNAVEATSSLRPSAR